MTFTEKQKKLLSILKNEIKDNLKNKKDICLLFSGGIDSAIIAKILLDEKIKFKLYSIGLENSHDEKYSKESASLLSLSKYHKFIKIRLTDIEKFLQKYISLTNDHNFVSISYSLPIFILLSIISEKNVVTGHGADAIFLGFNKDKTTIKINETINTNYKQLIYHLNNFEFVCAEKFNKNLICPYSSKNLLNFVLTLSKNDLFQNNINKYILRKVATNININEKIAFKPKKAIQYSTNFAKHIRKLINTNQF